MTNQNRLKRGNQKLAKHIAIFDLPSVKTCPNCAQCAKTCYARKSERRFPAVSKWRNDNYRIAKLSPNLFTDLIIDQIKRQKIEFVRIHSSGDFFSQAYIDRWALIARECPDTRFFAYTKTLELFDFRAFKALKNTALVNSILPDGRVNYGSPEFCREAVKKYTAFVCPATQGKPVRCGIDCHMCIYPRRYPIVFVKH